MPLPYLGGYLLQIETVEPQPCFAWNQPNQLLLKPNTVRASLVYAEVNDRKACLHSDARGFIRSVSFTAYLLNRNPKRRAMTVQIRARGSGRLLLRKTLQHEPFSGAAPFKFYQEKTEGAFDMTPDERYLVFGTAHLKHLRGANRRFLQLNIASPKFCSSSNRLEATVLASFPTDFPCLYVPSGNLQSVVLTTHYGTDKVNVVIWVPGPPTVWGQPNKHGPMEYLWDVNSRDPPRKLQEFELKEEHAALSLSPRWALLYVEVEDATLFKLYPRKDWSAPTMVFRTARFLIGGWCRGVSLAPSANLFLFRWERIAVHLDPARQSVRLVYAGQRQHVRCCDRLFELSGRLLHHAGGDTRLKCVKKAPIYGSRVVRLMYEAPWSTQAAFDEAAGIA